MEHIIECDDVVKIHRGRGIGGAKRGFKAVDGISLAIGRDRSYGLVGESGCGKTSFARALLYLDPPTSGSVRFDGTDLKSLGKKGLRDFRKRMQIVFQDPNSALNPKMSVHDSMSEGLINRRIESGEREIRVKKLLDLVGISYSYKDRFPHEFSGGQKQRIVIARALSMEPEFLVLDEPVSNLDVSIQAQIINLLSDLKKEFSLTYLFISHDLNLVSYMCDTIGVMFKGKIVEEAPSELLVASPAHPYTQRLLSSIPGGRRDSARPDSDTEDGSAAAFEKKEAPKKLAAACPYLPFCPIGDRGCAASAPALKEVGGDGASTGGVPSSKDVEFSGRRISSGHVVSCFKAQPIERW